jgi:hypothetical protein
VLVLEQIAVAQPWEAFRLPVRAFPLADPERAAVQRFWESFASAAAQEWKLSAEVFLQFAQLHIGKIGRRVSEHARDWRPQIGLGVWPDRPPPALWTGKKFLQLDPGDLPVLVYQLLRITKAQPAREQARNAMLGFGTVMEILCPGDGEALLEAGKQLFLPAIAEPLFRAYPIYVPLFEAKTLREAASDLEKWFCGAMVYLRESPEDQGVLIAGRRPLGPLLEKTGNCRIAGQYSHIKHP